MKDARYNDLMSFLCSHIIPSSVIGKVACKNFKRDAKSFKIQEEKLFRLVSRKEKITRQVLPAALSVDPNHWQENIHYKDTTTTDEIWRQVVRESEIDKIIQQLHRETGCGGRDKIIWLFQTRYYYWGLTDVVDKHRTCEICQQLKNGVHETSCKPILTHYPLEHLVIDYTFYDGTPIFVAIDSFSKYIWMWKTSSKEGCHVVKYLKHIKEETGLTPTVVRADRGGEFRDAEVHQLVEEEWGSKFIHGSPAHPQTQGVVERPNKTVKDLLDAEIRARKGGITNNIEYVRVLYNNRMHSTINMTPNDAFHTTKFMHPQFKRETAIEQLGEASLTANTIYNAAKRRAERNQRAHDKRKDPSKMIQVGDIVFHEKSRKDGLK